MKNIFTQLTFALLTITSCATLQGASTSRTRVVPNNWKRNTALGLGYASLSCGAVWLAHTGVYYMGLPMQAYTEESLYDKEREAHDYLVVQVNDQAVYNQEQAAHNKKSSDAIVAKAARDYVTTLKSSASLKKRKKIFGWLAVATGISALTLGFMSLPESNKPADTPQA